MTAREIEGVHLGGRAAVRPLHLPLGIAVVAGVPALVFVSVGPVAAVAGPPSVALWMVSAIVGLLMAVPFGALMSAHPTVNGGVAAASACVFRRRIPRLAVFVQWSYWLGWSPALGISAALLAELLRGTVDWPKSAGLDWLMAVAVMATAALVNHRGITPCAWLQAVLAALCVVPGALLIVAPLITGTFDVGRLRPFQVPGGWASWPGWAVVGGALFLAGWTAYGSEVALSYAAEYRRGRRDVLRSLGSIAVVVVLIYSVVPALLLGGYGATALNDPISSFARGGSSPWFTAAAYVALPASLLLTLNMISASGSRVLAQMAGNGEAWRFLGRLNRHGAPANALVFDVAFNSVILAVGLAVNGGHLSAVPVTLLTAASVAYFLSLILALIAAAINWWTGVHKDARPGFARGVVAYCLGLAAFNVLLLPAAVAVWGVTNVGLGVLVLVGSLALLARTRPKAAPVSPAQPGPSASGRRLR